MLLECGENHILSCSIPNDTMETHLQAVRRGIIKANRQSENLVLFQCQALPHRQINIGGFFGMLKCIRTGIEPVSARFQARVLVGELIFKKS